MKYNQRIKERGYEHNEEYWANQCPMNLKSAMEQL